MARPALFFYPPVYSLPDHSQVASPVTVAVDQVTTLFPAIPDMDGLVLILYWSQLCPAEDRCDFNMIDDVLAFWRQRGKKVVLSIATVGFPMTTLIDGHIAIVTATPDWLIGRVHTYAEPVRLIGSPGRQEMRATVLPRYDDPLFLLAVQHLVTALGRYDGNETVSQMRVSTGLLGEDNPSPDGYASKMPGFSSTLWLDYCRKMLAIYGAAFHKTPIEFDVGWICWLDAIGGAAGTAAAEQFLADLARRHVFVAFNGLESASRSLLSRRDTGPAVSLAWLQKLHDDGKATGLEAFGPLQGNAMSDVGALAAVINRLAPRRLVLFGSEASALDAAQHAQAEGQLPAKLQGGTKIAADRMTALLHGLDP